MLTSIRMTGTILLRELLLHFFLKSSHALLGRQALIAGGEDAAARVLRLHTALVEFVYAPIRLHQFGVMLADVLDNRVKFRARQARHRAVDVGEIAAAVEIVEHVQHRQPMPFDLRAAADMDNAYRLRLHGDSLRCTTIDSTPLYLIPASIVVCYDICTPAMEIHMSATRIISHDARILARLVKPARTP